MGKHFFLNDIDTYFNFIVVWQMLCLIVSMVDVIARQMLCALFGMWQMLLPRGRWLSSFVLADVTANGMWQMFLPLQCIATIDWLMLLPDGIATCCLYVFSYCMGRCYCPVADGIATLYICNGRCSIPFLDVLIIPDEEGNLKTTLYRKPTHTDLYL